MPTLDDCLDNIHVHEPGELEDEFVPSGFEDWYAVSNENESIIAYFVHEKDAYRFRMAEINRILNG